MKTTGTFQILQKVYKLVQYPTEFKGLLGNIPLNISMLVFGDSGHGKTELVMRMVKGFCSCQINVDWISYEQGHGLDIQMALQRNEMIEVGSYFSVTDPNGDKNPNTTYLEDLYNKIGKRGSADLFVIDSAQYINITVTEYHALINKFPKKGFIFISHKEGKHPEGTTAKKIGYDGGCRILVKNYIAYPEKNRFGGKEPYIVWDEVARIREPKFFEDRDKTAKKTLFSESDNTQKAIEG
jgi:hypothetical protein